MANTFTAIAPVLYGAARTVPRELVGLLGAVKRDFNDQGAAKGDTVKIGVSPIATIADFTAAQTFVAGTDRTPTTSSLILNQEKVSSWNMTAEEERSLENSGTAQDSLAQTVQQHIRAHVNAIETYAWGVARVAASRSTGTAGTDPFATDQKPLADALKILLDNGAGNMDLAAVIGTTAGTNLRKVSNLFKANEAGSPDLLRNGVLGQLYNFDIRESAAVTTAAKGTMTGALINSAAMAVGTTSLVFDGGTQGATGFVAGDTITIAGDAVNKYIVKTGIVAASGTVVIQEPGLLIAIADNAAITVGNIATQNLCLRRDAVAVVARPGLQPVSADIDQMVLSDPASGLSFLLYRKVGQGMASWYMRTVFDAFAPNPYAIAQLLG